MGKLLNGATCAIIQSALLAVPLVIAMPGVTATFAQEEDGGELQNSGQKNSITLETLVVTATGSAQTVPEAPATVTVIDAEEINSKPYASVADVLRDVPGVVLGTTSAKSGSASISMRGMGETYVLMMVDGRPVGNSNEATYNGFGVGVGTTNLPPPAAIERIEIIRGPMSSLYGTAALGGVINIITKPVSDVWTGSITGGTTIHEDGDEGGSYEGRFHLSGPLIPNVLGLTLYGSLHDRFDHLLTDGSLQDVGRDNLGGRLSWKINESQNAALEIARNTYTSESSRGPTGGVEVERMNYSLNHGWLWGDGFETNSFVNYEDVSFANGDYESGYSQFNANSKTNVTLGRHDLTIGGDFRSEETRHSPLRLPAGLDPVMTRWNAAVFAENNWHLRDDFTATLGLRYDRNERYGSHFTPRVYGVWDVSPSLIVKGGMSGGYKVPQLKQADNNIIEPAGGGRGWDQGNTSLKPEESTNYEIGAVWLSDLGFQFGVTAYHSRFKNKIDRKRICEDVIGLTCRGREYIAQYVNRDAAELNGVEVTLDFPIHDVDVSLNYTYADSRITKGANVGERFNNLPVHVANLGLDWHTTAALSVWGKAQYRSETFDTAASRVPDHLIVDIGFNYEFNENAEAHFGIYNVGNVTFDNDYVDGRRYFLGMTTRF
ncbi:MAG: TonB-dependent receptor [Rhizobiaceae bacterium]|nr:TonB-dependent receptor [Rhizobiaceae bacterium]